MDGKTPTRDTSPSDRSEDPAGETRETPSTGQGPLGSAGPQMPVREPRREPGEDDKPIGRRAFLGLVVAGVAALFLGKDLFSWIGRAGGSSEGGSQGTEGFRINSVAPAPEFDESAWRLTVDGLVASPLSLTFSDFTALPQVERTQDFYCVEGWGVNGVRWGGITVSTLMERAGVDSQVTHLIFHSSDSVHYTDSLTMEEARSPDTLLVHTVNGEPLPHNMGSPVRLIIPGKYGYKSVKWVVRVEAVALGSEGYSGYWEQYGYPADATIR
jgi:DMSO/TMAO reductase YedYZ molybdopterin-dependent catalytic subunit